MSTEWVDSNSKMPLREVLCLNRHTRVLFPLSNHTGRQAACTVQQGPQLPQKGSQTHTALIRLAAPASQWRSGSAINSPATKRLQPSRTNSPFRGQREAWRRCHRWDKWDQVSLWHSIMEGTASRYDVDCCCMSLSVSNSRRIPLK